MPPKAKRPPAPIDRPLSKAYLREFDGWSTAYPPGLSEPNSIRVMENIQITRDGAARVRPGLRSYMPTKSPYPIVGSHEIFYRADGSKAYLVAVRETVDVGTEDEREVVGFRVIGDIDGSGVVVMDTLEAFDFEVPADPNVISFTDATTYVKYLQIDNKIFALPNSPEGMLMFWVGAEKKAKKLESIVRPEWTPEDKLAAMHPDGAWVDNSLPSSTRKNLCTNPDFETNKNGWSESIERVDSWWTKISYVGDRAYAIAPEPERTNYCHRPLHDIATYGITGWGSTKATLSDAGSYMRITGDKVSTGTSTYAVSEMWPAPAKQRMRFAFDLVDSSRAEKLVAWARFYRSNGEFISSSWDYKMFTTDLSTGRKYSPFFTTPSGTAYIRLCIGQRSTSSSYQAWIGIRNVMLRKVGENTAPLDGDMGTDYYWEGTPNESRSLYQPAYTIYTNSEKVPVTPGDYTISAYLRSGTAGKQVELRARAYDSNGKLLLQAADVRTPAADTYERFSATITIPAGATRLLVRPLMRDAARTGTELDTLRVDAVLIERASSAGTYFSGATPNTGTTKRRWAGTAHNSVSIEEDFSPVSPTAETPTDSTLVSSVAADNKHNFSFFYTISNELGESAASQMTSLKVQRQWTAWEWKQPDGSDTDDPKLCADQIVVNMPQEVFDAAVASGATKWTAYYNYQGPYDAPPVTATRFAEIDLTNEPDYTLHGWARLTPQMTTIGTGDPLIPSESSRYNASDPVKGSQGIVAMDRLILVGNPADFARITWSSGAPGDYYNFSTLLGGGSKQLTSGNLYLTGCVKLWQNPQSVDTLTILNAGDDGRSNAFYMQPAQITSLSESISVMGFEEVSSMEGTTSPYGVEVVSNSLYRPLFHGLFKSTANNYNITTKPVSDTIENMWRILQDKQRIVSAQLNSRIYFLVHNILGETLQEHCRGNEVWVVDLMAKTPTWSRWLVQGSSLRAMDVDGAVMMSVIHPDGIFTFNEDRYTDERFNPDTGLLETVNIRWYLETNTQGANRAHDAWCNLQQANAHVGNFLGQLRYGVRGQDVNGMPIHVEKVLVSDAPPPDDVPVDTDSRIPTPTLAPTEREDYLLVRKTMKEWVFYAGSVDDEADDGVNIVATPRFGGGQINAVQYRYTPATVNVGYEYGSVETFEYGRSTEAGATTDSGTPQPYVDLSRA